MRNFGLTLANVYYVESWVASRPSHLGDIPVQLPGLGRSRDLRYLPSPHPESEGPLRAKRPPQTVLNPFFRLCSGPRNYSGLWGGTRLGKTKKGRGSQARALCFRLTSPPRRVSLPTLPAGVFGPAIHPSCPRGSSCPHVPHAAPLPTGLPSGPLGAESTARSCGPANKNHQARQVYALSSRVALRVEDAQRRRKCREKIGRGKKKNLTYTHARKTNFGVGPFQFHTTRPGVSGEGF